MMALTKLLTLLQDVVKKVIDKFYDMYLEDCTLYPTTTQVMAAVRCELCIGEEETNNKIKASTLRVTYHIRERRNRRASQIREAVVSYTQARPEDNFNAECKI